MYQVLGTATLKDGATAEIGCVQSPDPDDPRGVRELLAHKGEPWGWHVDEALRHELDGIVTRFYVAVMDGRAVSNVMTVEHGGAGILGHVYTLPDYRRRGLCTAIFERLMPDFRARDGLRLTLGTGYDRPAYWIYHAFGFRSVVPESGFMKYQAGDDFAARWYGSGPARVEPLGWRHWPGTAQLFADDFGQGLQIFAGHGFGPFNYEGAFVHLYKSICDGGPAQAQVLATGRGAVVGIALLQPDNRWQNRVWQLDTLTHPDFATDLPALLEAIDWPEAKVQIYLPAAATARREAVAGAGFTVEGTFRGQLIGGGDVVVYGRR